MCPVGWITNYNKILTLKISPTPMVGSSYTISLYVHAPVVRDVNKGASHTIAFPCLSTV